MTEETKEFKWVGSHPQEVTGGRVLEPGETVDLTDEDIREYHNEDLIARGLLIPLDDKAEHEAKLAERRTARRTSGGED